MKSPLRLTGIGLRAPHHQEVLEKKPSVAWLEVHTENYFGDGGKSLHYLEQIRADYPISLHGVSLSLGSSDDINWQHVQKIRDLDKRIDACIVSDHLSWSSIDGQYFHDLLPLPYTDESLAYLVDRVKQVQDYLQRQILIENISSYIQYTHSTIPEWEFLRELALQSGCGILLDVNNIYVSANNLGFKPKDFIAGIQAHLVQEIHLAGFTSQNINGKEILIDSHNRQIVPAVWDLFRETVNLIGAKPTMIEWDSNLPSLEALCLEAYRAEQIMRETYVTTKLTG